MSILLNSIWHMPKHKHCQNCQWVLKLNMGITSTYLQIQIYNTFLYAFFQFVYVFLNMVFHQLSQGTHETVLLIFAFNIFQKPIFHCQLVTSDQWVNSLCLTVTHSFPHKHGVLKSTSLLSALIIFFSPCVFSKLIGKRKGRDSNVIYLNYHQWLLNQYTVVCTVAASSPCCCTELLPHTQSYWSTCHDMSLFRL